MRCRERGRETQVRVMSRGERRAGKELIEKTTGIRAELMKVTQCRDQQTEVHSNTGGKQITGNKAKATTTKTQKTHETQK